MADHEHTRKAFEDVVFNRRFRASIKRNPNPPKGFGGLDFISTDCPTQAELCRRDADGDYEDEAVSAMWWGWCAALTHGVPPSDDTQRLDWLQSWNDVLLEAWFENSRIVRKVSRHGHVVGTGSTLREAIDVARGVPRLDETKGGA